MRNPTPNDMIGFALRLISVALSDMFLFSTFSVDLFISYLMMRIKTFMVFTKSTNTLGLRM